MLMRGNINGEPYSDTGVNVRVVSRWRLQAGGNRRLELAGSGSRLTWSIWQIEGRTLISRPNHK
jgi:hypothetical protein